MIRQQGPLSHYLDSANMAFNSTLSSSSLSQEHQMMMALSWHLKKYAWLSDKVHIQIKIITRMQAGGLSCNCPGQYYNL